VDRVWSVCNYKGVIRTLIHQLKYNKKLGLINFAASICCRFAEKFIDLNSIDYITFVPLDRQKKMQRDFNQSELIAKRIAKHFNIKILDNVLYKVKTTSPQIKVDGRERLSNLNKAFKVKRSALVKNKIILIIDDVLTTGSTLNECAGCLKQAGADSILALTLAGGN
jgi:ComF family protein